jgi:hypothetical protein
MIKSHSEINYLISLTRLKIAKQRRMHFHILVTITMFQSILMMNKTANRNSYRYYRSLNPLVKSLDQLLMTRYLLKLCVIYCICMLTLLPTLSPVLLIKRLSLRKWKLEIVMCLLRRLKKLKRIRKNLDWMSLSSAVIKIQRNMNLLLYGDSW